MRLVRIVIVAGIVAFLGATVAWASGAARLKVEKTKIGKSSRTRPVTRCICSAPTRAPRARVTESARRSGRRLTTTGKAVAGAGVKASLLGTTKRKDGKLQVTYKGHPLYLFLEDKKPGDTKGEGSKAFGAGWYALTPTGVVIDRD